MKAAMNIIKTNIAAKNIIAIYYDLSNKEIIPTTTNAKIPKPIAYGKLYKNAANAYGVITITAIVDKINIIIPKNCHMI
jgi:hypothetical protein